MKDILTVIKFTMRDMLGRKSFRISTIIILILIVLGFNLPNIITSINGGDFNDTILISDPDNIFEGQLSALQNADLGYDVKLENLNADEIKTQINDGDLSAAILIKKSSPTNKVSYLIKNTAIQNSMPVSLSETLNSLYVNKQIQKLGLSAAEIQSLNPNFEYAVVQTEDQEIGGNIGVMMILSCVLFFAIYFCAYQVSSSITVEKTSKIMETLVTSTSPRTIVLGKTIGIGLVGLLQMLLFVITAIISAYSFLDPELLSSLLDLSNVTLYLGLITIVYFVLGYFVFALLYALTGSTVSKPEDIQSANMPVAFLCMIGFYLAYFTLIDPTGDLNIFASLFPFSSPFCMPLRIMMGLASGWDVALSILILILTCAIVARIAIKIYSNAILNYGSKMSLRDIIKTYRAK